MMKRLEKLLFFRDGTTLSSTPQGSLMPFFALRRGTLYSRASLCATVGSHIPVRCCYPACMCHAVTSLDPRRIYTATKSNECQAATFVTCANPFASAFSPIPTLSYLRSLSCLWGRWPRLPRTLRPSSLASSGCGSLARSLWGA